MCMRSELWRSLKEINFKEEEWKPVTYPKVRKDRYEVSSYGQVLDLETGEFVKQDRKPLPKDANDEKEKLNWFTVDLLKKEDDEEKPCITIPVSYLVGYEFIPTVFNKDKCGLIHANSDYKTNYYENLMWLPVPVRDIGDEQAFFVCQLKTVCDDMTRPEIADLLGVSISFVDKVLYRGKRKHIKSLFDIPKVSTERNACFTDHERLTILYLLALGMERKDIPKLFKQSYQNSEVKSVLKNLKTRSINMVREGKIPNDITDPRWFNIAKENEHVRDRLKWLLENDSVMKAAYPNIKPKDIDRLKV